jgi:hypothetical protein
MWKEKTRKKIIHSEKKETHCYSFCLETDKGLIPNDKT